MTIRECAMEDSARICELNKVEFGYEYPLDKTKERLALIQSRESDKLLVICHEGEVIGYVHGSDYECTYSDSLKNIMAIAVDHRYRGLGAGRLLMGAVEQWARDCGCCGVRLVSGENRKEAHGFYAHLGYKLRKEQKNFIKIF